MLRRCYKCELEKDLDKDFHKRKLSKSGHTFICKACANGVSKAWQKANLHRYRVNLRRRQLKHYGLTLRGVEELRERQGGHCGISGRVLPPNPHVDHDHKTFLVFVRGLLDNSINIALGCFRDNPVWLRRAADYIEDNVARYWGVGPRSDYELHLVKEKAA